MVIIIPVDSYCLKNCLPEEFFLSDSEAVPGRTSLELLEHSEDAHPLCDPSFYKYNKFHVTKARSPPCWSEVATAMTIFLTPQEQEEHGKDEK